MVLMSSMQTAIGGLKANQAQLDLIGRNITNVNTVGYTRKVYAQNSTVLDGKGSGVSLSKVMRTVDEGLLKSFLTTNSTAGGTYAKSKYMNNLESVLGTPLGNNSISENISSLKNAFENIATNVNSPAARYELVSNAKSFTDRLNSLTESIQKARLEADQEITTNIDQINTILDDISNLNNSIVKYSALGYDGVADLEDQRDEALRALSSHIDITYYKRESGEMVIQTANGINLLDKQSHKLSHSPISQSNSLTSSNGGGIQGIFIDGIDITSQIKGGSLAGLLDVRDREMPSLQSQLDELAIKMKETINKIHNMGTSYPAMNDILSGTKTFIDSSIQQIKIENGDIRFNIFDKDGNQVSTATLGSDLGFSSGTIDTMTNALETWLQSPTGANLPNATASVGTDGKFVINTGDSEYTISIMDTETSHLGAKQTSATIKFDANGDGIFDKETEGFSNFFGLNDFFVTESNDTVYDSRVLNKNYNLALTSVATLSFSDKSNGMNYASININPGDKLETIVSKINEDPALKDNMKASLVPSGEGFVLRITNSSGEQLEITETSPTSLINRLGLDKSSSLSASEITVREDLLTAPGLVSVGSPEYNKDSGKYIMSQASNNIANALAKAFSETQSFRQAGNLSANSSTFSNYAATFVGSIASNTSSINTSLDYQSSLLESIAEKEAKTSGVDMDNELIQMIMFKQSYSACAQIMTASQEMIDTLIAMVR